MAVNSVAMPSFGASCGMAGSIQHVDPARTLVKVALEGKPSLMFTADLDVNTDGSGRSYHPDDPRGKALALNNVGNAIKRIYDAQGADITCSPRKGKCFEQFIKTFEAARDADWAPTGHPRVTTDGMIPWKKSADGRSRPCIITSGPHAGYFVSPTAMAADPSKGACDQDRYLDSLRFNAVVLPGGSVWKSQGKSLANGDLVAVLNPANGVAKFAIVGDRGPAQSIGEGTVLLAAQLRDVPLTGKETYREVRALAISRVHYLGFPGTNVRNSLQGQPLTQALVDTLGLQAFEAWGGHERLKACAG